MRIVDFPDALLERIASFVGPEDDIFFRWTHAALARAARAVHGAKPRTRLCETKLTMTLYDYLDKTSAEIPMLAAHTLWAARNCDEAMLAWLHKRKCPWHEETSYWAAQKRSALELVLKHGCPRNLYMACGAAAYGDVEALRYAVYRGAPLMSQVYELAAASGDVAKVSWLLGKDPNYDSCVAYAAANKGHLEVLELLHENGELNFDSVCNGGAEGGSVAVMKWAETRGGEVDQDTCACAVRSGDIEALRYLRERQIPCPWDEEVCDEAARSGNLPILAYARSHGCPWTEFTPLLAIQYGHFDVLQWIHENGFPMFARECVCAAQEDNARVFMWLRAMGCACERERCMRVAGENVRRLLQNTSV